MALDLAALEAALPAATITAVAGTPNGLTTSGTQVYVARKKRAQPTSPEAWWRPANAVPDAGGLGLSREAYAYELTVEKDAMTLAEQRSFRDQLFTYFHGYMRPFVSGLYHAVVDDLETDLHDGEGPAAATRLLVTFREK